MTQTAVIDFIEKDIHRLEGWFIEPEKIVQVQIQSDSFNTRSGVEIFKHTYIMAMDKLRKGIREYFQEGYNVKVLKIQIQEIPKEIGKYCLVVDISKTKVI